jgi:hypothetical protein
VEDRIPPPSFFVFPSYDPLSLNIRGRDAKRVTSHGLTSAASTSPGKGVSQGEEAVLAADSGRVGERVVGALAGEEKDWFSTLLFGFGALDRSELG